ncbi:metallophosphoesterase [archaeon]|nr:metallophosphoesterase [archaeon]
MFITNERAMLIGNKLVIADVHLGITGEIYKAGVSLPSQMKPLVDKIHALKKASKAKELVLLGDVKHHIPWITFQELKEVPLFLSSLRFDKVVILKGNHDGKIESLIPEHLKGKIVVRKSLVIGDYLLTHGHRSVKTKKHIIIGHNHPNVKFTDHMGSSYIEPVWIKSRLPGGRKIIIMPAFNPLAGSMVVNEPRASSKGYKPFLGPVAKKMSSKIRLFLLDGTDIGRLQDLKK